MLTPQRSFVLQIDTEADMRKGEIFGKVEHVATGQVLMFKSLAGLLEILEPHGWQDETRVRPGEESD